ncbi:MAG TPA: hypothetical protein VH328_17280, partial [Burkholderiaceae bacterium]|nr:hypothetical protein [Burkholderiaceae bacterium]
MTARRLLMGLGLLALGGCADRTYLTPTHGRAYAQVFSQQLANPEPIENDGRPIQGLDSQEATTISRSYNKSLSAKDGTETQPTIIMNPAAAPQQGPIIPPPSVPDR